MMNLTDYLTTVHVVNVRLSDDNRYLTLTEERTIDLLEIDLLTRDEQWERQACLIGNLFREYVDYHQRDNLQRQLRELLRRRIIEYDVNGEGEAFINVLRNTGQANLIRLLLSHATSQKRHALQGDRQVFTRLKRLLLQRLRHQGQPLSVNSLSVTLQRAVSRE